MIQIDTAFMFMNIKSKKRLEFNSNNNKRETEEERKTTPGAYKTILSIEKNRFWAAVGSPALMWRISIKQFMDSQ